MLARGIYGFAKMPLQESIFASWYNIRGKPASRIFWAAAPPASNARPRYLRLRENALASKHFRFMV